MDINKVMQELAQYNRIAEETAGIIDGLKDQIKEYMTAQGLEVLTGEEHRATYKAVTSDRLDTKAIKAELPEIAQRYTTTATTMRFTFA